MTTEAIESLDQEKAALVALIVKLSPPDQRAALDFLRKFMSGHFDGWQDRHVKGWLTKRRNCHRGPSHIVSTAM